MLSKFVAGERLKLQLGDIFNENSIFLTSQKPQIANPEKFPRNVSNSGSTKHVYKVLASLR